MEFQLIYNNKLLNNSYKHHRKRRRKQRKRHADRFFRSRLQKFNYYYTKFNSFFVLKNKLILNNKKINNLDNSKYKLSIKSNSVYYLKPGPLVSILKFSKKYLRKNYIEKYLKYKISVFPNFWFTAKPKAVRMGKGKGEKKRKIYFLKKGETFYEIRMKKFNKKYFKNNDFFFNIINLKIYLFLSKIKHKLPVKNKILKKKI